MCVGCQHARQMRRTTSTGDDNVKPLIVGCLRKICQPVWGSVRRDDFHLMWRVKLLQNGRRFRMVFQSDWLPMQMAIFRDDLSVDPVMI